MSIRKHTAALAATATALRVAPAGAVAFVLVAATLAACGSDGDDDGAAKSGAVTKTTYVASADAI